MRRRRWWAVKVINILFKRFYYFKNKTKFLVCAVDFHCTRRIVNGSKKSSEFHLSHWGLDISYVHTSILCKSHVTKFEFLNTRKRHQVITLKHIGWRHWRPQHKTQIIHKILTFFSHKILSSHIIFLLFVSWMKNILVHIVAIICVWNLRLLREWGESRHKLRWW